MAEGNFSKARIEAYLGRKFTRDEIEISNAGKPDSLNYISYWSDKVEKTSMIGKPAENPKPAMSIFSFFKNIFNSLIINKILLGFYNVVIILQV